MKAPSPIVKMSFRPRRSASEPAISVRAASARTYESTTHWRSVRLAPRSRSISGSATFTIVMSSRSMNVAIETVINVHHLRAISPPP